MCNGCRYHHYRGVNAREEDFEAMMAAVRADVARGLSPAQIIETRKKRGGGSSRCRPPPSTAGSSVATRACPTWTSGGRSATSRGGAVPSPGPPRTAPSAPARRSCPRPVRSARPPARWTARLGGCATSSARSPCTTGPRAYSWRSCCPRGRGGRRGRLRLARVRFGRGGVQEAPQPGHGGQRGRVLRLRGA